MPRTGLIEVKIIIDLTHFAPDFETLQDDQMTIIYMEKVDI